MAAEDLTVLAVAGEEGLLDDAGERLEREGGRVEAVVEPTASDALDRIEADRVDCVVSEYRLEGTTGLDLLSTVREKFPALPFVVFTERGSERVAGAAVDRGADSYLTPDSASDPYGALASRVRELASEHRHRRSADSVDAARRAAERTDAESTHAIGRALEATGAVVWDVDLDSYEVSYYPSSEVLYGAELETVEEFLDRVHPGDRPQVEAAIERSTETGSYEVEFRVESDGEYRWIADEGRVHYDSSGRAVSAAGVGRDVTERVQRERELRRSERRFEAVFQDPEMLIGLLDPDGTVRQSNRTALEVIEADRESVVGEPFWELPWWNHSESLQADVRRWIDRAADGEYVSFEADHPRTDGGTMTASGTVRPVTDDDGEVVSLIVSARDVTERKRREAALSALHGATREFMDAVDKESIADRAVETARDVLDLRVNGVWLYDEDDDALDPVAATDEAVDLLDEPPTYRGGDSLTWAAFESNEVRVYDDLDDETGVLNPETPIKSEMILPLGEYGVMNVGSTDRQAFDQVDVSLASILAESVEAALARADREQLLRDRRRRLERVRERTDFALDATDTVIWDVNLTTGTSRAHGPSERVFGTETVAIAEFLSSVPHPEDREEVEQIYERIYAGEIETFDVEFRTAGEHGDPDWVRASGYLRERDGDEDRHVVGLATDITEQKRYQREIERQNERLDEFASIVSHDLRNPLNTAIGRLELLAEDCDSDHLPPIERSLDRMETIIGDTLALARQGERVGEPETVALSNVAERCWRVVDTGEADLRVDTDARVEADRERLEHVFENLFRNAAEHAGPDPTVRVGTPADGGGFYVADDGPGIPPEDRETVFDSGYTTERDGTGFGLSIVREIAEAHDWSVSVTESADGGARFELTGVSIVE